MSGYMCPSFCMCDSCSTTHVPLTQKGSDRDMLNTIYKLEQRLKEAEEVLKYHAEINNCIVCGWDHDDAENLKTMSGGLYMTGKRARAYFEKYGRRV